MMEGISSLLMEGIIGATFTFTGIPFSDKIFTVSSLLIHVAVRGSISRRKDSFKDVIEIVTPTNPFSAIGFKISRSRVIKEFLVIMPVGCLNFSNTSSIFLVI